MDLVTGFCYLRCGFHKYSEILLTQACPQSCLISNYWTLGPNNGLFPCAWNGSIAEKCLSRSSKNDLQYFSLKINSYSQLDCALLPMCKVFHFECQANFRGKKKCLELGFSVYIGSLSIIFKTFNNNHFFFKFKKFIYNASKYLRAILKVSILKIVVVVVTCLSSLKFWRCVFEEILLCIIFVADISYLSVYYSQLVLNYI